MEESSSGGRCEDQPHKLTQLVEEGLVKLAAVAKRVVAGLGDCGPFPQGSGSTSSVSEVVNILRQ